ncbi:hypothetical protein Glove_646g10 [Diversispora epigaea]|uniref:Uncharacterized protein n=1 Tax=Diversispora epigaea TaxID=1348612 RepID=A0A397GCL1_9GLOM|nr:hypothetical protein Glove_646g10 [Diversispora epigaea]
MPPTKRRKTDEENIKGRYNLDKVKATKEWTKETFEIQNIRKKGEALELKALQILRAQNIITNMSKAHLLEETKEGTKLKQIIGDGGIDLFGEITVHEQTIQWIGQLETSNSDIFLSHIEELHTIRKQIEIKQSQKGIRTMSITKMFIEEMEDVEFDKNGRILKAKRIKNVSTQIWGTSSQNEDILN